MRGGVCWTLRDGLHCSNGFGQSFPGFEFRKQVHEASSTACALQQLCSAIFTGSQGGYGIWWWIRKNMDWSRAWMGFRDVSLPLRPNHSCAPSINTYLESTFKTIHPLCESFAMCIWLGTLWSIQAYQKHCNLTKRKPFLDEWEIYSILKESKWAIH